MCVVIATRNFNFVKSLSEVVLNKAGVKSLSVIEAQSPQRGELRKAVDAIYAYPQQGKLTLVGRKAFNLLLANAMEQGVDRDWYAIDIGDLAKDIRYDSNDIKRLENTLNEMQRTLLKWDVLETIDDETVPVRDSVQLLGAVRLVGGLTKDGKRSPIARAVHYQFDPRVKKRLLVPEVYARINLQLQATIKSAFTLALYEQLIRYRNNITADGWAYTVKLPWREWRNLILGGEYNLAFEEYKYFSRDVLVRCLKELNERIFEYDFEVQVFKDRRVVTDIQFRLRERVQAAFHLSPDEPLIDTEGISHRLEAFDLKKLEINKLIRMTDLVLLEEAADETELRIRRGDLNPIRNKPAYFQDALRRIKDRSRGGPSYARGSVVDSEAVELQTKLTSAGKAPKKQKALTAQEPTGRSWAEIEERFLKLPENLRNQLIEEFIDQEKNPAVVAAYAKQGFKSAMAKVAFTPWFETVIVRFSNASAH